MSDLPNVYDAEPIPDRALGAVKDLMNRGDLFRYTADVSPVALLETEFAEQIGSQYALAVSSCSAALFLSLMSLDLPANAPVLIPAFTFAAVPSSVVHAGCLPVLVECKDNYRIDMHDFRAKLPGAKAVIISHMRGHTSDMDAIMEACDTAEIPVIEDAAHSIGTTWNGRNIGTLGNIGCFSFQSYKLLNAGEGGIMVSNDPDLIARAVIMSGAYEHNWKKHRVLESAFARWQNKLPLYNLRLNNLSAAIVRAQLAELPRRVSDGRRNHDHTASRLNESPWLEVPPKLQPEERAPDSIQFNLVGMSPELRVKFAETANELGVKVQIFGHSSDNARAFWNWQFFDQPFELPQTRSMLVKACDVRLPARLTLEDCDAVAAVLVEAAAHTMAQAAA